MELEFTKLYKSVRFEPVIHPRFDNKGMLLLVGIEKARKKIKE